MRFLKHGIQKVQIFNLCKGQTFCATQTSFYDWMQWILSEVRSNICSLHFLKLNDRREEGCGPPSHRGYYLTGDGVDLNQALISYGLDFLRKKGYKKIQPPFMMSREIMGKNGTVGLVR